MSYIELLILRHLSRRPAHGYELRKRVEGVTGVTLHNNSLYPALRRFEEAGALLKTSHPQQGRPPKLVYELTDVGRELLHDMLAELPADQASDDTEFMTRLGQFEFLAPAERLAVIDARDAALAERLGRLAGLREKSAGQTWSEQVTAEVISRTERERSWLGRLRELAGHVEEYPAETQQHLAGAEQGAAGRPESPVPGGQVP